MKRFEKKGSHVGMVLSFVIFITFIFFFYIVFEPSLKSNEQKKVVLDNFENNLIENLTADLIEASIFNNTPLIPAMPDVFCLKVPVDNFGAVDNFIVKKIDGSIVNYNLINESTGDNLLIEWEKDSTIKLKIYGGQDLKPVYDDPSCNNKIYAFNLAQFFESTSITNDYISLAKVNGAVSAYKSNYNNFRTEILQLSSDYDFEFSLKDSSGKVLNETNRTYKPTMIEFYAREVPVIYFDENANVQTGSINIRIW